jgi:hypothetical protein
MEDEYRYYEILGLNRNASSSEISRAYRSLAKTYHPDVSSHPRALENFQKIQQAYEALSDPRTRNEYDAYLDALEQSYPDDDFQPHFDGMDDIYIEHEFYAHNEPIIIRGQSYRLDYVRHLIISGREYIEYNGEHLPYDRGYFPFDTHTIDNEFYVSNEVIEIDGEEYTFATAHHVVITGQEYIEYNGEFLPFSRQEHPEPHQQGGGWLRKIAKLAIILVVAFTVYHGFLIGTSGTTATAGDDTGVPPPNPIRTTSPATSGSSKVVLAPTPVRTTSPEVKYSKLIADAMDPENPVTRNYALSLIDKSHGGERNIAQVCDIWEKVYNKWTYVSDPKGLEYFSSASNTIKLGLKGDCDDFAILVASLIEATGGGTRIILAHGADGGGHAYPEVYITSNKEDFNSIAQYICKRYHCKSVAYHLERDKDGNPRYWLNLDWQSRHPGGKFYKSDGVLTAYYSNGYWYKFRSNV